MGGERMVMGSNLLMPGLRPSVGTPQHTLLKRAPNQIFLRKLNLFAVRQRATV